MPKAKKTAPDRPLYLKEVLTCLEITQAELTRRLGLKHHTEVSDWIRGPYFPSWSTMVRIAEALEVSLDTLAGRYSGDSWSFWYDVKKLRESSADSVVATD